MNAGAGSQIYISLYKGNELFDRLCDAEEAGPAAN